MHLIRFFITISTNLVNTLYAQSASLKKNSENLIWHNRLITDCKYEKKIKLRTKNENYLCKMSSFHLYIVAKNIALKYYILPFKILHIILYWQLTRQSEVFSQKIFFRVQISKAFGRKILLRYINFILRKRNIQFKQRKLPY